MRLTRTRMRLPLSAAPRRSAAAALLCLLLAACGGAGDDAPAEYTPLVAFAAGHARVITDSDTIAITVEIAEREEQRAYGLMERPELPADHGMIFVYTEEQPGNLGFWMYRTRIPLDIAYLDEHGSIVAIRAMDPCPHAHPGGCPTYAPNTPYWSALEMNRNWFAQRGVGLGDRVVLQR